MVRLSEHRFQAIFDVASPITISSDDPEYFLRPITVKESNCSRVSSLLSLVCLLAVFAFISTVSSTSAFAQNAPAAAAPAKPAKLESKEEKERSEREKREELSRKLERRREELNSIPVSNLDGSSTRTVKTEAASGSKETKAKEKK